MWQRIHNAIQNHLPGSADQTGEGRPAGLLRLLTALVGILVGPANRGSLRFEDCHVEGFQGNGLYASPSNGPVEVVGGLYANNGIASVRVSSPATVRDVTVRCDEAPAEFRNMRGIRLRHGDHVLVENCTVEFSDLTYSAGGVVVEPMMESATIRNVEVDVSAERFTRHVDSAVGHDVARRVRQADAVASSAALVDTEAIESTAIAAGDRDRGVAAGCTDDADALDGERPSTRGLLCVIAGLFRVDRWHVVHVGPEP